MNMKKTIAGIVAGAVAVSAMATSAFATETVHKTYRAGTDTYAGTAVFTVANPTSDKIVATIDDGNADVTFKYEVVDLTINGTKYEGDAAKLYAKFAGNVATITPIGIEDGKPISMTVKATVDTGADKATKTAFDAATVGVTDGTSTITNVLWKASTTTVTADKVYMAIPTSLTDLDLVNTETFAGIDATIANDVADATGAKLVFKIKDLKPASTATSTDNGDSFAQSVSFASATSEDLGIMLNKTKKLSTAASIDKDAMTVTFDWDTLLKNSNISNAIGEVSSISIIGKGVLDDTFDNDNDAFTDEIARYVIESITVVTPDAAVTEATTTDADATTPAADDSNPKTGAAPVALALIPAALAAVVVAKKRK